jgi:hypothetical protein
MRKPSNFCWKAISLSHRLRKVQTALEPVQVQVQVQVLEPVLAQPEPVLQPMDL